MKKNYFMLVCLMLVMAFQAKAQVTSVADLFGEYKFTADVEFASDDYKTSYGSIIVNESDVTIGEDPYSVYDGAVFGFAGSSTELRFNFRNNTLMAMNSRSVTPGSRLLFADADANNPYGVFKNGSWAVVPFEFSCTCNPTTKEITIPDFTVVTVADAENDEKGALIATYKNAKLTYVGGSETDKPETPAYDWAGTYTFTGTPGAMDENAEYPSTFDVVVEFHEATAYADAMYVVTNFMGNDLSIINYDGGIKLTIASDGKSATLANGCVQSLGGGNFLKLFDMNATANPIAITLNDDGTLSMADFSIVSSAYESNTGATIAWYQNVTLSKSAVTPEVPAFTWDGVYNVTLSNPETGLYIADAAGYDWPQDFQFKVACEENENGVKDYYITEIFGMDVNGLNNGGLKFVPAEDGKSALISTGYLLEVKRGELYLVLRDVNNTESEIELTVNEDGTMSVFGLSVATLDYKNGSPASLNVYYSNLVVTKEATEEPEIPVFDWVGEWTLNSTVDNKDYPSTFSVVIEYLEADDYNPAMYAVTSFMGYDVKTLNYGAGIELAISEDGKSATLANGLVYMVEPGVSYLKLRDMNAQASPIALTVNEDGTVSVADFTIMAGAYSSDEGNQYVAWYRNVVLTKGGEVVEPEEPEAAEKQYRVKCDNGYLNVYSTYAYPTGPIGGVNVVEKADDNSQIFTMEDAGDGAVYLKSVSGYYLYCQSWNVDGNATEKSALTFEDAGNDRFYIKCAKGYFKVEYVSNTPVATINGTQVDQPAISGYFPYCDAPVSAAALWTLEEAADETGIEDVVVEAVIEGIYDMQGRKIDAIVAPGLYIINGKKILVK